MIKILQANLQHAAAASAVLVKTIFREKINVSLIQEPYIGGDGRVQGLGHFNGSLFAASPSVKPRCCILTAGLAAKLLPDFLTRDLVACQITINGLDSILASAYFPHNEESPTIDFVRLVKYCGDKSLQLLVGCDANSHNEIWGSSNTNARGEQLLEYLWGESNLHVLNVGSTPTFKNSIREEVLDITVACNRMQKLVRNWKVTDEESLSDHAHISYEINSKVTGSSKPQFSRNPRRTDWEKYVTQLELNLAHLPCALDSVSDLEENCNSLTEAISEAFYKACPLTENVHIGNSTPWWSWKIEKLRRKSRRLSNRARHTHNPTDLEEYKKTRNEYKNEIRAAKRSSWRSFCEGIDKLPVATRLQKTLGKDRRILNGPLAQIDGGYTENDEEALNILANTHFPGCRPITDDNKAGESVHHEHELQATEEVFTEDKVLCAIDMFSPYKCPGLDGIFPALLQHGSKLLAPPLTRLFQACLSRGYIPNKWQLVKVIFIPKPGKTDYTKPNSFRPISLSSFVLKCMERVIEWHMRSKLTGKNEINGTQHAFRTGRSTETALHHLVTHIEANLNNKEITLCCFADIEGAFNNVYFSSVTSALCSKSVDVVVARWINEMLKRRTITMERGESILRTHVGRGLPQGGIISPIIWCCIIDELLDKLQDSGFYVQAYADDVVISVTGTDETVLRDLLQRALILVAQWCVDKGLAVNPEKIEIVRFSRRRKLSATPELYLNGFQIHVVNEVKFLGVIMDGKLLWASHLEGIIKKARNIYWTLRLCVGKTWGLSPKIVRWLYTAIVRPALSYGSVVWWRRCQLSIVQQQLSKLQRMACIAISGAIRTTPSAALEVLLDLPPVHLFIEKEATMSIQRMGTVGLLSQRANAVNHASDLINGRRDELLMPCDRIPKCLQFTNVQMLLPSREDWTADFLSTFPAEAVVWYTDGSFMNGSAGAGVYCSAMDIRESIPLGEFATVFQAEVVAIQRALQHCWDIEGKDVVIFSDSQAAIKAIKAPIVSSALVRDCKMAYETVSRKNEVLLSWVPGHQGIEGNEIADQLAKEGSEIRPCAASPIIPVPWASIRNAIDNRLREKFGAWWHSRRGLTHAKRCVPGLDRSFSKELIKLKRTGISAVVALLTGHGPFRLHLDKIGIRVESVVCRFCEEEEESGWHILEECPALMSRRWRVWAGSEKLLEVGPTAIARFMLDLKME